MDPNELPEEKTGWIGRFKGGEMALPPMPRARSVALAGMGGMLVIWLIGWLSEQAGTPLVLGSFGATCVLVFGFPDVPFSQPRNIIVGHVLSTAIGLAFLQFCGPHWWAAGLATGVAVAAMMVTRTVHPPAGSNPLAIFLAQPGWAFLLQPTLAGALLVTIVALLYNNLTRSTNYPKYW